MTVSLISINFFLGYTKTSDHHHPTLLTPTHLQSPKKYTFTHPHSPLFTNGKCPLTTHTKSLPTPHSPKIYLSPPHPNHRLMKNVQPSSPTHNK